MRFNVIIKNFFLIKLMWQWTSIPPNSECCIIMRVSGPRLQAGGTEMPDHTLTYSGDVPANVNQPPLGRDATFCIRLLLNSTSNSFEIPMKYSLFHIQCLCHPTAPASWRRFEIQPYTKITHMRTYQKIPGWPYTCRC